MQSIGSIVKAAICLMIALGFCRMWMQFGFFPLDMAQDIDETLLRKASYLGGAFQVVSSFFTMLAFLGVLATLYYQHKTLQQAMDTQRENSEAQSQQLSLQADEVSSLSDQIRTAEKTARIQALTWLSECKRPPEPLLTGGLF